MTNPKRSVIFPLALRVLCGLVLVAASVFSANAGVVKRLIYENINGLQVADLTNNPAFPSRPSSSDAIAKGLEAGGSIGINYGAYIRGYIEAPLTGNYTFWIASDDTGELWLSSDHQPANLRKICENPGWVAPRNYKAKAEQKSAEIPLVKGEKYYFEVLHKQAAGLEHVSVGWQMPGGQAEYPISAKHLWPAPENDSHELVEQAPQILTDFAKASVQLNNVSAFEAGGGEFIATAIASQPAAVRWYRNGQLIPGEGLLSLTVTNVQLENDVDIYTIEVSNAVGVARANAVVSVLPDREPPKISSVLNLGTGTLLAVLFSKAVDAETASRAALYALDHNATVRRASRGADNRLVLLETSPLTDGRKYTLTVRQTRGIASNAVVGRDLSAPVEQNLETWLKFDTMPESDLVADASGHGAAKLQDGARIDTRGRIGGALFLDGAKAFATLPEGFESFPEGLTVAVWARPTAKERWARFIDLGNGPGKDNIVFARRSSTDDVTFDWFDEDNQSHRMAIATGLEVDQWQHLAAVLDHDRVVVYRNGEPLDSGPGATLKTILRTSNLIGRSNWSADRKYAGWMDDLRIYSRPLSALEVRTLATAMPTHDTQPPELVSAFDIGVSNLVVVVFSKPLAPATASNPDNYKINDSVLVLSAQLQASGRSVLLTTSGLKAGLGYNVRATNIRDTSANANAIEPGASVPLENGLKLWLKFDEVNGLETPDASGGGFSATLHNGAALADSFADGKCMQFHDTAYLQLPEAFENFTNGITIMLWANPERPSRWCRFIDFGNGPATDNMLFGRPAMTSNLAFESYKTGVKAPPTGVYAGEVLKDGEWQHIAVSVSPAGNAVVYKDGALLGEGECNLPDPVIRTRNYVGRSNWDVDGFYQGRMDDLRIYNRSLTAVEIAAIATALSPTR